MARSTSPVVSETMSSRLTGSADAARQRLGERAVAAARPDRRRSATLAGSVEKTILIPLPWQREGAQPAGLAAGPCAQLLDADRLQPPHRRPRPREIARDTRAFRRQRSAKGLLRQASRNRMVTPARSLQHLDQRLQAEEGHAAFQHQQILAADLDAVAGDINERDRVGVDGARDKRRFRAMVSAALAVAVHRDLIEMQPLEAARHQAASRVVLASAKRRTCADSSGSATSAWMRGGCCDGRHRIHVAATAASGADWSAAIGPVVRRRGLGAGGPPGRPPVRRPALARAAGAINPARLPSTTLSPIDHSPPLAPRAVGRSISAQRPRSNGLAKGRRGRFGG